MHRNARGASSVDGSQNPMAVCALLAILKVSSTVNAVLHITGLALAGGQAEPISTGRALLIARAFGTSLRALGTFEMRTGQNVLPRAIIAFLNAFVLRKAIAIRLVAFCAASGIFVLLCGGGLLMTLQTALLAILALVVNESLAVLAFSALLGIARAL